MRDVYGFYRLFGQLNSQEILAIGMQGFKPGRKKEACLATLQGWDAIFYKSEFCTVAESTKIYFALSLDRGSKMLVSLKYVGC